MRKRLKLEVILDKLAEDMWGEITQKIIYLPGLIYYKCKYYQGFLVEDKNFKLDKELKSKINPMTIIEKYNYHKETFIIERTDREEKIPDKILSKFNNKRYSERINIYPFTEKHMNVLKYYHREILKHIYENKLDEKSIDYKSLRGYVNSEIREIMKDLTLNSPEFIKKKDKSKAKDHLKVILNKDLEKEEKEKIKEEEIELIKDMIDQKLEVLCI